MKKQVENGEYTDIEIITNIQTNQLTLYLERCLEVNSFKESIVTLFKMFIDDGWFFTVNRNLFIRIIVDYINDTFEINQKRLYKKGLNYRLENETLYSLNKTANSRYMIKVEKEQRLPMEELITSLLYCELGSNSNEWESNQFILEVLDYQKYKIEEGTKDILKCIATDNNYNELRLKVISNEVNSLTNIKYLKSLIINSGVKTEIEKLALLCAIDEFKNKQLGIIKRGIIRANKRIGGSIYAMENEFFIKDCLKVGRTEDSVRVRAIQLSASTAVPGKFKEVCSIKVMDIVFAENVIHKILENKGKHLNKEYYLIDKEEIQEIFELYRDIENSLKRSYIPISSFIIVDKIV